MFQFVIFPVLVVAACVGVFLIFGLISYEPKSLSDYLLDMRTGGSARRWHAAFELSKKLANQRGLVHPQEAAKDDTAGGAPKVALIDRGFVASLLDLYEKSKQDDRRLRQYLALCLGYVQGAGVRDALMASLDDPDPVLRFYAVWSLAVQNDTSSVPRLIAMLKEEDPELRKVIVYSLGVLKDPRAIAPLKAHLNDPQADIAWNAALALARFGDATGEPMILKMLDRDYLGRVGDMSERQKEQVMINAIRASALFQGTGYNDKILEISKRDPNVKVRQAALVRLRSGAK